MGELRRWQKLKARALRTFWTKCPRCGKWFGGHEKFGRYVRFPDHPDPFRVVCPDCAKDATGKPLSSHPE